ncbi:phage tail protein [Bartonella harrusi]|uniref:Phage tail protein n=1 Tax=Bartonella harrusi TaxID=2961895 RepID=A0ABY5EVT9_9HYPH|nr:phage tail protein [Bartonella harrusi]UTO29274.1 phage tail protein [Bartonella harrusi]
MQDPLMMLGPHQFYVDWLNFQYFEEEFSASWVSMERFGKAPSLQFTGYGNDAKTIHGVWFPEEFGDCIAIDALTMTIRAAKPVQMLRWVNDISYSAIFHGPVVITSITKDHDYISRSGQSQRIRYSISLLPFFDGGKPQGYFQEGRQL